MSYVKHEWKSGDIVSSKNLNEMEDGIFNSQEKITADAKLSADLLAEGTTNKLVSEAEKTNWNSKSSVSVPESSTSNTEAKYLKIGDTEYKLASGEGKIWKELTLTSSNLQTLITGGEVVGKLDPQYDDSGFKNDYFMCDIEQVTYRDAKSIWVGEQLGKVYVQTAGFEDAIAYVINSVVNAVKERGFDYNYYKTIVLYGSNPREQGKTRDLGTVSLLNATNVIYLQDVSQQGWEYNYEDPKVIEKMRREQLYTTEMGKAFLISIRGKDNTVNNCATFIYCMQNSQTSYWDTEKNCTRWANIEAGEVYPVHFDTTHDTLRWMLDGVHIPTGKEDYYGVPMIPERKQYLRETGIEFSTELVEGKDLPWLCSAMVQSPLENIYADCLGIGINELNPIFSFNTTFGEKDINILKYIGRPNSHIFESIEYTVEKEGTAVKVIEKDGYYLWVTSVDGVEVQLIIPDNYYVDEGATEATPHRDTYFVRINFSNIDSTETIYRHTFTITTPGTINRGDWELNLSMCAVNPDQGDSAMDYLLHSDETGQEIDWVLPVSGTIGRVVGYSYKGNIIRPEGKYSAITLTPAYDLAKFEDLWDVLPKQLDNKYYIFYGTDRDQSRLINMRIEKESIDHAYDLYVYDDVHAYLRFVTQQITEGSETIQKGFYMWDYQESKWQTTALDPSSFYDMFNSSQGVQGSERAEIEGERIFVGWDNSGLFEIFSSSERGSGQFRDMNVVAHTFTAMRMLAGWQTISDKQIRTLFVDFIDKVNELNRAAVVTDSNSGQYICRDFRSEVLMVRTPYMTKSKLQKY